MKKVLIMAVAAIAMSLSVASATETPIGTVTAGEGGYVLNVDGDASNPDPIDGFVSVREDGQVCADDNGSADDGDASNGAESTSPTCSS